MRFVAVSASAILASSALFAAPAAAAAAPPATIGQVLAPGAAAYTVVVPADPTVGEQQALFNAMAALTSRFPAPTMITPLVSDAAPAATNAARVVTIREDTTVPGNTIATTSQFGLAVTGSRSQLTNATVALSNPTAAMSRANVTYDVVGEAGFEVADGPVPLSRVASQGLKLAGTGVQAGTLNINQPAFGQPIEQLELHLRGTAPTVGSGLGATANASGSIKLKWNGAQVAERALSEQGDFDIPLLVGQDQLQRDNKLQVELHFAVADAAPTNLKQPTLEVDMNNSSIAGTPGDSVPPGFELLPQGLGGYVAVATGQLGSVAERTTQAATLAASLQSATPLQLAFGLWEKPEDLASASENGIVVGADANSFAMFNAPDGLTPIDPAGAAGQSGEGLAQLIAYNQSGRNLLVLGSRSAQAADSEGEPVPITDANRPALAAAATAANKLAAATYAQPGRWNSLTGQALAMGADGTAVPLTADLEFTQNRSHTIKLVGLAVLAVLLVAGVVLWRRRR